jgi:hypothetical protein
MRRRYVVLFKEYEETYNCDKLRIKVDDLLADIVRCEIRLYVSHEKVRDVY